MSEIYINQIDCQFPGLYNWQDSKEILSNTKEYKRNLLPPQHNYFSKKETRRYSNTVLLALTSLKNCLKNNESIAKNTDTIFASSSGETEALGNILASFEDEDDFVSPNIFHNSVHNTPSGYWSIINNTQISSNSIACYNWSFATALVTSYAQIQSTKKDVLLCVYDTPYPEPLDQLRDFSYPGAISILFSKQKTTDTIAAINISLKGNAKLAISLPNTIAGKSLWLGNPVAQGIPLLEHLATKANGSIIMEYYDNNFLECSIKPC